MRIAKSRYIYIYIYMPKKRGSKLHPTDDQMMKRRNEELPLCLSVCLSLSQRKELFLPKTKNTLQLFLQARAAEEAIPFLAFTKRLFYFKE